MKNKLSDLNDHLFCQLERLGNESLKGEKLQEEIARGKGIEGVAMQIISNANLVLKAQEAMHGGRIKEIPEAMRIGSDK